MLGDGSYAPGFRLPGAFDGTIREFSLEEYSDDIVVLAFYPTDFTPTSTDELWLRDLELFGLREGVTILGISADSAYSHRAFAEEYNIEFPLLSDTVGDVAEEYGVLQEEFEGHRRVPERAVFVVGLQSEIRYAWTTEDPTEIPPMEVVRKRIESITDDETAVRRYASGYEYYEYGQCEFDQAMNAFDADNWEFASDTFWEACGYFDAAADSFNSSRQVSQSPALKDQAERARQRAALLTQSCRWLGRSGEHYSNGNTVNGGEYYSDARDSLDSIEEMPELRAPEDLPVPIDVDD